MEKKKKKKKLVRFEVRVRQEHDMRGIGLDPPPGRCEVFTLSVPGAPCGPELMSAQKETLWRGHMFPLLRLAQPWSRQRSEPEVLKVCRCLSFYAKGPEWKYQLPAMW